MGNTQQSIREPPENSEEKEDDLSFTCEICIEPISQNKRFKNKKRCTHPFCLDCIAKYIEVKVADVTEVKCPGLNCEKLLDPLSCRPILSSQVFEKWCDVLCNLAVLKYERVYCPFSDCSTLILNECKDNNITKTKCPNCKNLFCFKCKRPWHAGFQCSENREMRDTNDILFGKLVERKNWKRCPSCNYCVELLTGCLVVKCRCGTSFCHGCGRKRSNHLCWCKRSVSYNQLTFIFLTFIIVLVPILIVGLFVSIGKLIRS